MRQYSAPDPLWQTRSIGTMRTAVSSGRSAATLIFDGDCGFCTTAVNWLSRNLPAMPRSLPFQWASLDEFGLTADEAAERVWLVIRDSEGRLRQYGGYLAVSVMLRHQPRWSLRFLGVILDTPPFSWAAGIGYYSIARYRYLLPGGTPACKTGAGTP